MSLTPLSNIGGVPISSAPSVLSRLNNIILGNRKISTTRSITVKTNTHTHGSLYSSIPINNGNYLTRGQITTATLEITKTPSFVTPSVNLPNNYGGDGVLFYLKPLIDTNESIFTVRNNKKGTNTSCAMYRHNRATNQFTEIFNTNSEAKDFSLFSISKYLPFYYSVAQEGSTFYTLRVDKTTLQRTYLTTVDPVNDADFIMNDLLYSVDGNYYGGMLFNDNFYIFKVDTVNFKKQIVHTENVSGFSGSVRLLQKTVNGKILFGTGGKSNVVANNLCVYDIFTGQVTRYSIGSSTYVAQSTPQNVDGCVVLKCNTIGNTATSFYRFDPYTMLEPQLIQGGYAAQYGGLSAVFDNGRLIGGSTLLAKFEIDQTLMQGFDDLLLNSDFLN